MGCSVFCLTDGRWEDLHPGLAHKIEIRAKERCQMTWQAKIKAVDDQAAEASKARSELEVIKQEYEGQIARLTTETHRLTLANARLQARLHAFSALPVVVLSM